jgi:hypothetical protein
MVCNFKFILDSAILGDRKMIHNLRSKTTFTEDNSFN